MPSIIPDRTISTSQKPYLMTLVFQSMYEPPQTVVPKTTVPPIQFLYAAVGGVVLFSPLLIWLVYHSTYDKQSGMIVVSWFFHRSSPDDPFNIDLSTHFVKLTMLPTVFILTLGGIYLAIAGVIYCLLRLVSAYLRRETGSRSRKA
ncbi:MAG: hypothetical protein R3C03_20090 [Pirellulaceae bacterium]